MATFRPTFPLLWATLLAVIPVISPTIADDWPQWRGPQRDGVWRESGLRSDLPEQPLVATWRVPVALGYAGPAVADGKVYLFEYASETGEFESDPSRRPELKGLERLRCLDSKTGQELWKYEYECTYKISYPSGPRCTPTVDEDRVYVLGAEGDLSCLNTTDGSKLWSKSFREDYGIKTPVWGHSAHPLVDGDTLYCLVGGEGTVAVAFDKYTGKEKWRSLSASEPGYCPPTMMNIGGAKQLVVFYPRGIAGLLPTDGKTVWHLPMEPSYGMSIAQPLLAGDRLFATGYNDSVCIRLPEDQAEPDVLWAGKPKRSISSANVSPIFDGQAIYGVDANDSALIAVDPATGDRFWKTQAPILNEGERGRHGTVFIVRQGKTDRYWLFNEKGQLLLARLTAEGYEELGRQRLLEKTSEAFGRSVVWSHPAFAEKAVFARNDKELIRVDLSAP